jgi:hypothetical protein
MIGLLALAEVAATAVPSPTTHWYSLNHSFSCALATKQKKRINLAGEVKVEVFNRASGQYKIMIVWVRSPDPKWRFIHTHARWDGGAVGEVHAAQIDVSDGDNPLTSKDYEIELYFPSALTDQSGPLGVAVLRDANDGTPLVLEGRRYPIMASGICEMAPMASPVK